MSRPCFTSPHTERSEVEHHQERSPCLSSPTGCFPHAAVLHVMNTKWVHGFTVIPTHHEVRNKNQLVFIAKVQSGLWPTSGSQTTVSAQPLGVYLILRTLCHAVLYPLLMGEDENSHVGTGRGPHKLQDLPITQWGDGLNIRSVIHWKTNDVYIFFINKTWGI